MKFIQNSNSKYRYHKEKKNDEQKFLLRFRQGLNLCWGRELLPRNREQGGDVSENRDRQYDPIPYLPRCHP